MRVKLLIMLGMCCVAAAVASCPSKPTTNGLSNNTVEAPIKQPETKTKQPETTIKQTVTASPASNEWDAWINHSPLRDNMRRFWVDMAQIVANSARPELVGKIGMELLESAAEDIARRSGRMRDFWKDIRDHASHAYINAKAGNWDQAEDALDELHHTCGGCHFEYWTQGARAYIPGTLQGWVDNGTPFGEEPWGKQAFIAPEKVRASMRTLQDDMLESLKAVARQDKAALSITAGRLRKMAHEQYQIFSSIARSATQIVTAAENGNLASIEGYYNEIAIKCIDCHAQMGATRGRAPLPWTAARDE